MVAVVDPFDAVEIDHRDDVLAWLGSGAEIFRTAKPATPPKHLVSYCALVDVDHPQILLVDHRLTGLWLPPGGHVDPGEHPAQTAAREMREELGIEPEFHRAVGEVTSHTDVSLWFAFEGSVDQPLSPDPGEFHGVRWWGFGEVVHGPGTRFDPHLPRFVQKIDRQTI